MGRTILLLTIIGLGTAATATAPGKLFAQGAGGGGGSGGGSAGGSSGAAGSSGLGGSAMGGATGAGLSGTPGAGSGLGSGLRGGASGSGQAGPGAAAPAPRPPLGSPNVGNIGAPTMIDPASQPAPLQSSITPAPAPMNSATMKSRRESLDPKNPNTTNSSNPAGRAMGRLAGDWRYVYRNGRHWYWMPNQTWQLWNGSSWQPYAPGMQSRTAAANELPRRMSGYRAAGGAGAYGDNT